MEWNWCAARGPAAITHYKPIQPRHSLLSFAFGLSFRWFALALSSISSLNQFHSTLWMNWWRWKEGKRRVVGRAGLLCWLVAVRLLPPLTHQQIIPIRPSISPSLLPRETHHFINCFFSFHNWFSEAFPWAAQLSNSIHFFISLILKEREWKEMNELVERRHWLFIHSQIIQ